MNRKPMNRPARAAGALLLALLLGWALAACEKKQQPGQGGADVQELVIGLQCDRTGPTQNIGVVACEAIHDYVRLFNRQQGLGEGYALRVLEVDHGYNVPRSLEAYERFKQAGAVSVSIYGTPQVYAATPRLTEDKIPGTSPGFGNSVAADGRRFPYVFPIAATYWSQIGAVIKFIMDGWEGDRPPRIAYLHLDNPSGREPLPVLHELRDSLGFTLKEYAVPLPAIEMRPQALDIVRNFDADWIVTLLFGRGPSVSIKEMARLGFPRERMISLAWGSLTMDVQAAGAEQAEGYHGVHFTGVGGDFQVMRDIRAMYEEDGQPLPDIMQQDVLYSRGVFIGALHARAIQLAMEKHGYPITGDQVREGFESVRDFDLGGFLPPLTVTPDDHEGGGWVKIYQVRDGRWQAASDWMQGHRDVVLKHVAQAE